MVTITVQSISAISRKLLILLGEKGVPGNRYLVYIEGIKDLGAFGKYPN